MKTVLVTGASGFIGRHCLKMLVERGYLVHAVTAKPVSGEATGVRWHRADLLDRQQTGTLVAAVSPTHLLHLAWDVTPGQYWHSAENIRWTEASLGLLQAFAANGGRRVVAAGTCAEYDWRYGYCSEQVTPLKPATLYGACKHSLQSVLTAAQGQAGYTAAWGRLFFLFGPYEHPGRLVPAVITSLLRGEPALCSHGNQIRDFLHVEDAASALTALLESSLVGPVNIASGVPVALKTVIELIAEKLDSRSLIRLGALPAGVGEPGLLVADTSRLAEELCWQPIYTLERGLEATIEWWRGRSCEGGRQLQ